MNVLGRLKANKELKQIFQKVVIRSLSSVNPVLATKLLFRLSQGHALDLERPQTLNEKLQYLKLNTYYNNPMITQCVDKYRVREYLIRGGYERLLNDLVGRGFYESVDDIDFDELPEQFVLKCNHDSGSVIVCKDKEKLDRKQTLEKLDQSLKADYWKDNVEVQYKFVKKGIVCEKYLEDENGSLVDYKFYCYNGVPRLIYCTAPHEDGELLQMDFYDLEWNRLPIHRKDTMNMKHPAERPKMLTEMLEIARELSKPFPFVRVDLFCVGEKIYFSEFTFIPTGGLAKYEEPDADKKLGEMLTLN